MPTSGSIRFKDREVGGLTPDAVCHRGIARTFQIPRPFRKLTILENVAVAAHYGAQKRSTEAEARQRATEILKLVGLPADPEASTALLGAGGLKKLELARALATRPKLLRLDEVLAGLNPQEVAEMIPVVRGIAADGITVLMIEHVMQAVMHLAQRVWVLAQGQLIAEGPPAAVTSDARVIEAYLGHGAAARLQAA
jgi:branched-chain amino acid transport system ATP-binding protein